MKDVEPQEITSKATITMYKEFTWDRIKEKIDIAITFARIFLRFEHNKPEITNRLLSNLGVFLESWYGQVGDMADQRPSRSLDEQSHQHLTTTPTWRKILNNLGSNDDKTVATAAVPYLRIARFFPFSK